MIREVFLIKYKSYHSIPLLQAPTAFLPHTDKSNPHSCPRGSTWPGLLPLWPYLDFSLPALLCCGLLLFFKHVLATGPLHLLSPSAVYRRYQPASYPQVLQVSVPWQCPLKNPLGLHPLYPSYFLLCTSHFLVRNRYIFSVF